MAMDKENKIKSHLAEKNINMRRHIADLETLKVESEKSQEKIRALYAEIYQIFSTTTEGICVIDTDFNVVQINEALSCLASLSKEQAEGRKCYDVIRHQLCFSDHCVLKRILAGENLIEFCITKKDAAGKEAYLTLKATPHRQLDGKLIGIIESFTDITSLKKAEDTLRYYLDEITGAQEDERKRISRELHDSAVQTMTALARQLDNFINEKSELPEADIKKLRTFYMEVKQSLQELRELSRDLLPPILEDLGLIPAIKMLMDDFKEKYEPDIELEVFGNVRQFTENIELLIFRVIQESMRNVIKHAQATKIKVVIEFLENKTSIVISDNGIGFNVPNDLGSLPQKGKLGLAGIHERVKLMQGSLDIKSKKGRGTKIYTEFPF